MAAILRYRKKLKLNRKTKLKIAAAALLALIIAAAISFFVCFSFFRAMNETRVSLALAGYSREVKQSVSRGEAGGDRGEDRGIERTIIVAPGDTLWDIASRYYPNEAEGRVVWALKVANGLESGGTLRPGMRLELPRELK